MVPAGETRAAATGAVGTGVVKDRGELQGPTPTLFQVWTNHEHEPMTSVVGVTEQVPVPDPHPTSAAEYHLKIFGPALVESLTWR